MCFFETTLLDDPKREKNTINSNVKNIPSPILRPLLDGAFVAESVWNVVKLLRMRSWGWRQLHCISARHWPKVL